MKKTLTRGEMLDLWRNIRMAEPLRLDCVVERTDGPDLTAFLEGEMRAWYLHLLDRGDLRYVCPTDVVSTATVSGADLKTVEVSPSARRVLNVEFVGWGAPVAVNASEAEVRAAASNPFSRRPLVAAIGSQPSDSCRRRRHPEVGERTARSGPRQLYFRRQCHFVNL